MTFDNINNANASSHDHGSHTSTREDKRESELVVIKQDGNDRVLSYAHRMYSEIIPNVGIIIYFSFGRMTIEGRNLKDLHILLGKRQIAKLIERHVHEREVAPDLPYITNIFYEFKS